MKFVNKIFTGILLTFFVFSLVNLNYVPSTNITPIGESLDVKSSTTSSPHRVIPVSILVYTQYVDLENEFVNMMSSIRTVYGPGFHYENLTDYTKLKTELPKHDILVIPEQEKAPDNTTLKTIGNAWKTTLTDFVNDGGIVILMSYRIFPPVDTQYGHTAQILKEAGLLTFTGVTSVTGSTLHLINSADALARGVSTSFIAPSGTISFNTTETTAVVTDGASPAVIHKIMGNGHIILLGFDFNIIDGNTSMILSNAIRLHQHVVFDASHIPLHFISLGFYEFATDLVSKGFAVSSMGTFSSAYLSACDVLVLTPGYSAYNTTEIDAIEDFVKAGGGLFIVTDWTTFGNTLDPVMLKFGFSRDTTNHLNDTNDYTVNTRWVVYGSGNIWNHSITQEVSSVELYRGTGLQSIPTGAKSLITTDTDGTGVWSTGTPAIGITVAACAVTSGNGRVAVLTDMDIMRSDDNTDGDATVNYFDAGNQYFLVNNIRWLSAAGIEEQKVLFEQSRPPQFTLGISYKGLGYLLTANGFTIHWSNAFQTSLINQMDILLINDGYTNYTPSEIAEIKSFVAAGGGLILLSAYDGAAKENYDVGLAFGIDIFTPYYLEDSDDSIGSANYIEFEGSNFASHFITQGVARVEFPYATGFSNIGDATALITTDTDGTCTWSGGGAANGIPIIVAKTHLKGRLVYSASYVQWASNQDGDSDGIVNFYEQDNCLLIAKIFQWLAGDDTLGGGGIPGFSIIFVFVGVLPLLLLRKKVKRKF